MNISRRIGDYFIYFFGLFLLLTTPLVHGQTLNQEVIQGIGLNAPDNDRLIALRIVSGKLPPQIHFATDLIKEPEPEIRILPDFRTDTLRATIEKKLNSRLKKRNLFASLTFGGVIVAELIKMIAEKNYTKYRKSTNNATELHDRVLFYDQLSPSVYGLSAICLLLYINNQIRSAVLLKDINAEIELE